MCTLTRRGEGVWPKRPEGNLWMLTAYTTIFVQPWSVTIFSRMFTFQTWQFPRYQSRLAQWNALFWAGNEQRLSNDSCMFCSLRAGRFSSFRLYFSSYNLLIGWQVLRFQILSRITQMAPVQMKVVYDYYSMEIMQRLVRQRARGVNTIFRLANTSLLQVLLLKEPRRSS